MLDSVISPILLVTGIVTMLPVRACRAGAMLLKAGLVGLMAAGKDQPHTRKTRQVFAFDVTCTLLSGAWLLTG